MSDWSYEHGQDCIICSGRDDILISNFQHSFKALDPQHLKISLMCVLWCFQPLNHCLIQFSWSCFLMFACNPCVRVWCQMEFQLWFSNTHCYVGGNENIAGYWFQNNNGCLHTTCSGSPSSKSKMVSMETPGSLVVRPHLISYSFILSGTKLTASVFT